jgi:hypothetical protein
MPENCSFAASRLIFEDNPAILRLLCCVMVAGYPVERLLARSGELVLPGLLSVTAHSVPYILSPFPSLANISSPVFNAGYFEIINLLGRTDVMSNLLYLHHKVGHGVQRMGDINYITRLDFHII